MRSPRGVFLTGMMRSGTTYLAHLMNALPRLDMFAQPLPLLHVALTARFLEAEGAPEEQRAYPIRPQQFDDHFDPARFQAFLESAVVSKADAERLAGQQAGYSGVLSRPDDMERRIRDAAGRPLADFILHYLAGQRREGRTRSGWKETVCEAFIPYMLAQNVAVAHIIRDPRDVLRSMNHGEAARHVGAARPLLFIARQWRKSAAYALRFSGASGYGLVRYEDLAADPSGETARLARALGTGAPESLDLHDVTDRRGRVWRANTSRVEGEPLALPEAEGRLVEAFCLPEMCALGYDASLSAGQARAVLSEQALDETIAREALQSYAFTPERRAEELARLDAVENPSAAAPAGAFVFDGLRERLRETLQPGAEAVQKSAAAGKSPT